VIAACLLAALPAPKRGAWYLAPRDSAAGVTRHGVLCGPQQSTGCGTQRSRARYGQRPSPAGARYHAPRLGRRKRRKQACGNHSKPTLSTNPNLRNNLLRDHTWPRAHKATSRLLSAFRASRCRLSTGLVVGNAPGLPQATRRVVHNCAAPGGNPCSTQPCAAAC